jgi:hypothetical protein
MTKSNTHKSKTSSQNVIDSSSDNKQSLAILGYGYDECEFILQQSSKPQRGESRTIIAAGSWNY